MKTACLFAMVSLIVVSGKAFGVTEISRHVIACGALGATSATYEVRSTLGEAILGAARSVHHTIDAGFWRGGIILDPSSVENPPGGPDPSVSQAPAHFQLYAMIPNPTDLGTRVSYDVPASGGRVSVRIYDAEGSLVRKLVDHSPTAGRHVAVWDGRNEKGRMTASGVYFLRMEAPGYRASRTLTVLR